MAGRAAPRPRDWPLPRQIVRAKDRRRMEVSTVTKVGDRDVIRTVPFVQIKMALAAGHKTDPQLSAVRSACRFCRGRRRRRPPRRPD